MYFTAFKFGTAFKSVTLLIKLIILTLKYYNNVNMALRDLSLYLCCKPYKTTLF